MGVFALLLWGLATASADVIPLDRVIDWSLTGHPGGIPARANIAVNVLTTTNGKYKCAGDGVTDDTTALSNAINDYSGRDAVIYLPTGRYRIASRIYLQPWKNRWTLRGEGVGNTVIVCEPGDDAFYIGNGEAPPASNTVNIASGYTKGSTNIVLARINVVDGSTTFAPAVGRLLLIDQLNDGLIVTEVGCQGVGQTNRATTFDAHGKGLRNQAQLVTITAMSSPTNITFWPPLYISYNAALTPQASVVNPNLTTREIGFESLTFTNKANTHNFIVFNTAYACWIKNVEFVNAASAPILISDSLFFEASNCYQNGGAANSDCSFYLQRCDSFRFEDNIFRTGGFIFCGCRGGVVAYNLFTNFTSPGFLVGPVNLNHGAHSYMNLFEGNVSGGYFQADYYWGSSGLNTFFRNRILGKESGMSSNLKCLALDRNSLSNNVVGNVLGTSAVSWNGLDASPTATYPYEKSYIYRLGYPMIGNNGFAGDGVTQTNAPDTYDPRVQASLLRHGNYDYASKSLVWDLTIAEHTLSDSLYLPTVPSWWGTNRWPAIDPLATPTAAPIPAQLRYLRDMSGTNTTTQAPPPPPTGLHVQRVSGA
jgi:hypothetical protein